MDDALEGNDERGGREQELRPAQKLQSVGNLSSGRTATGVDGPLRDPGGATKQRVLDRMAGGTEGNIW